MVMLKTMRNVQHWHEKEHLPVPMESCWDCGRQKAKCKAKLFRYPDLDMALREVRLMNEADNYERPRVVYGCPWCDMYHFTTKLRQRRSRVTKEKRKWLFQKELERREMIDHGAC